MKHILAALALCLGLGSAGLPAAEWKPAEGPLKTRWAKDVRPDRVLPEYPRPQLVRKEWLNLNGVWELGFGKAGETAPVGKTLPESILVPFPVESALSGVMKHADRLWYHRTFEVPKNWAGRRLLLHFGAVDWEAAVLVNGKELGVHRGGFDPFELDITDALTPAGGPQDLLVGVFDPTDRGKQPRGKQVLKPEGIYYTPNTGIWQTVWLEPAPAARIQKLKVVPDIDAGLVRVTAVGAGEAGDLSVVATATDGGKTVATATGKAGAPIELPIAGAKLWSPDSPFLYGLNVKLARGAEAVDAVDSYFGMRKISVGPDEKGVTRLLLNGKFVFQVGPLDQGFWPDGIYTAPTEEALRYDIEITKKLGFNMTRKHVKVEPDRWYYWCDRLGLLVWQDMPSGDDSIPPGKPDLVRTPESARQYEVELRAMMAALENHPSIIVWVVFNEGWGQFDTPRITALAKSLDPSRLINCASGWNDHAGVGDMHDYHVYPGPGSPDPEPKRAAVLGEFGGLGLGVDGHTWTAKTWGYRGAASKDDLTSKYERLLLRAWGLRNERGMSAAVYTQLTDVETEANGLLTYDREILKVDLNRASAVNSGSVESIPELRMLVPTSRDAAQTWRYTTAKPAGDWASITFDASTWKEAPGGFGTKGTPGSVVRTEWSSPDIWVRREVTLGNVDPSKLVLIAHHDEEADIYINGVLAAKATGYTTDYEELPITAEARAAIRPGKANVIAAHCHQTGGGQYLDVGLGGFFAGSR